MRGALAVFVALLLAGAARAQPRVIASEHSGKADFDIVQIAGGLDSPWGLAFLPGGDALISQRTGAVVRMDLKNGHKTVIPGAPKVLVLAQGGLLDIALSPDFAADRLVYFSYAAGTRRANHTAIARGRFMDNAISGLQVIFRANTAKKRGGLHFGSRLAFGRDGMLYASIGEGFRYMDEAQNLASLFGKIIRITPDGRVPPDNPFIGKPGAAPEIYSYGHRNPQGLAVRPRTGALWEHEHGPRGGDEINIIRKGANYGWPKASFGIDYSGAVITPYSHIDGMEDPVAHWTPSIAPSGLAFYTGDQFPGWRGNLFAGALAGQQLRRVVLRGDKVVAQETLLDALHERIRDVRNGPGGLLYVLTDGAEGKLLALRPSARRGHP